MLTESIFEGFEDNIKLSLQKYGFICRNEKSDQFLCFYKIDNEKYDYGFMYESEITDLINLNSWLGEEMRNDLLKCCNQDLKNFNKLPFLHKAYSLIHFLGYKNIMGPSINPLTFMEVVNLIEKD